MEKQIIKRGYLTYALTNGEDKIFGMVQDCYINEWKNEGTPLYWSEVYVEPGHFAVIIRKGISLVNKSDSDLSGLYEQSKINLC